MTTDINFKSLWNEQKLPATPNVQEIFTKANRLKRKKFIKMLLNNLLLASTLAFIVYIAINYHSQMITTKIGIALVVFGIASYLSVANKTLTALFKSNLEKNSKEYLNDMIELKKKQEFLQKTMLNIYFILLTSGILLYMIEPTSHMSFSWGICSYVGTVAWIALNWFLIRPRTIKKQQQELNEMISLLENVSAKGE